MPESFAVLMLAFGPHLSFLEIAVMFAPRVLWRGPEWWLKVLLALEATRDFRRRGR